MSIYVFKGYSSSVQADKRSIGQSSSPAPDNRRGAAAAAAAAMVAAAHSAQPGLVENIRINQFKNFLKKSY